MEFQELISSEFRVALSKRQDILKELIIGCREGPVIYRVASVPVVKEMELEVKQLSDLIEKEKENMFTATEKLKFMEAIRLSRDPGNNWKRYSNPLVPILRERPSNPPKFKHTARNYCEVVRQVEQRLEEAIGEILYLEKDYKRNASGGLGQHMALNSDYPPCPQPELTYELPALTDPLTILIQDSHVAGLEVLKDGKWVAVEPHPGAFVINGGQLQVITYGASAKDIKKILCAVLSALKEKNSYLGRGTFGTLDPLPGEPSGSNFGDIIFCAPVSGSSSISSRVWILDTGATHHMCNSPSSFQNLDSSVNPVVTVANGQTVSVAGIGSVRLYDHLTLENVMFAPEFLVNAVSVSALTQQHHCTAIFASDYCFILDLRRGQVILLARRSGNLYVLN